MDRALADPNELRPEAVLRFGCALDFGEVLYGNIGSPARLDFTVLGPAVNLTSRLEALTNEVGETSLISERFAGVTQRETRCLGGFTLKGIAQAQQVVAPPWASDVR